MKIYTKVIAIFLGLIVFLYSTSQVLAHDVSLTYTSITANENKIYLGLSTPFDNILSYYPEKDRAIEEIDEKFFIPHFKKGFVVKNNGKVCDPKLINSTKDFEIKSVNYQFEFTCPGNLDKVRFDYNLFFNVSEAHENIAEFTIGQYFSQIIFSQKQPSYELPVGEINSKLNTYNMLWERFTFFVLGIKHILIGYDHILFLIGLLLITISIKSILKIVTSFTVAHSITLIMATLGIFAMPQRITESLIALSIVYVALENIFVTHAHPKWKQFKLFHMFGNTKKRWMITFLFGLIHGFGFSFVLRELGLPKEGLIQSLLLFNVGVEIGQLAIVAPIFPILWFLRKTKFASAIIIGLSVIIGLFGLFWFIQRVFFG